jgi:chemotaxis signal transduction protein
MRIPGDQIEPPSSIVTVPENSYLRGIAKLEDRLVSLMELDGVLPAEQEHPLYASDEQALAA